MKYGQIIHWMNFFSSFWTGVNWFTLKPAQNAVHSSWSFSKNHLAPILNIFHQFLWKYLNSIRDRGLLSWSKHFYILLQLSYHFGCFKKHLRTHKKNNISIQYLLTCGLWLIDSLSACIIPFRIALFCLSQLMKFSVFIHTSFL